jgi:hypothetical protein
MHIARRRAVLCLALAASVLPVGAQKSPDICELSENASAPHLPWCSDRDDVPCHESPQSCRKLAETVRSACRTTYQNCYVRFAKVSDKQACSTSLEGMRKQLDGLACNWPRQPRVGTCGGKDFVRYADVVKVGGVTTWRNNNPGAITCLADRAAYGAFDTCKSFAIFPSMPRGILALHQWLVRNKALSIYAFATTHAPHDNGAALNKGNDPGAYADRMIAELRRDHPGKAYTRQTRLGSLSEDELGSIARAITMQEGSIGAGAQGQTYELDAPEAMPKALRACLGL